MKKASKSINSANLIRVPGVENAMILGNVSPRVSISLLPIKKTKLFDLITSKLTFFIIQSKACISKKL